MTDREINAKVAAHIMGWKRHNFYWVPCSSGGLITCRNCTASYCSPPWTWDKAEQEWCGDGVAVLPDYSTDMNEAWGIAEALHDRGFNVQVSALHDWRAPYECTIWWPGTDGNGAAVLGSVDASTAPKAICLAALRAVGVEV